MTVVKNNQVGTVQIPENAQLQVTFTYTVGPLYDDWRSVLSIGKTYYERMPAVFIDKDNKIWFNWNMDTSTISNQKRIEGITLTSGKKYSFHFYTQKNDRMTIRIQDGTDWGPDLLDRQVVGQVHNLGTHQPIFVGDNYFHPDGGVLENLIIREFKTWHWEDNPILWTYNDRTDSSEPIEEFECDELSSSDFVSASKRLHPDSCDFEPSSMMNDDFDRHSTNAILSTGMQVWYFRTKNTYNVPAGKAFCETHGLTVWSKI